MSAFANSSTLLLATFLPLIGALVLLLVPKENTRAFKQGALIAMTLSFIVSLAFWFGYDRSSDAVQWTLSKDWMP
ncbi:MAG TPA: hypothetical protein VNV60_04260, partial [Holophagaceae bacterium]|nr:hypothetical protein [Holophagaceae bacterium]